MFVLICEITKHILICAIDHNVELQTSLQQFSNFTNEHKQCVNLLVASIWKCKYIEWDRLIFCDLLYHCWYDHLISYNLPNKLHDNLVA